MINVVNLVYFWYPYLKNVEDIFCKKCVFLGDATYFPQPSALEEYLFAETGESRGFLKLIYHQ